MSPGAAWGLLLSRHLQACTPSNPPATSHPLAGVPGCHWVLPTARSSPCGCCCSQHGGVWGLHRRCHLDPPARVPQPAAHRGAGRAAAAAVILSCPESNCFSLPAFGSEIPPDATAPHSNPPPLLLQIEFAGSVRASIEATESLYRRGEAGGGDAGSPFSVALLRFQGCAQILALPRCAHTLSACPPAPAPPPLLQHARTRGCVTA